jgi:uncharacterized low-complexity protein
MSNKTIRKPLAVAVGAAFATSLASTGAVNAAENPFAMTELPGGYMVASKEGEGKCGGEKKEAEGKCGGEKKEAESTSGGGMMEAEGKKKEAEGKCGEGKCGATK